MNCWHCDRPAHRLCQFCGRAVCKEHVKTLPHIVALYRDAQEAVQALSAADYSAFICETPSVLAALEQVGSRRRLELRTA